MTIPNSLLAYCTSFAAAGGLFLTAAHAAGAASSTTIAAKLEVAYSPPPESAIPDNEFGKMVREGQAIFTDTSAHAGPYVGNALKCSNCHLDAGRTANAAPLGAAYVAYPAYREKNKHVNTFAERLQECFKYSMNGVAPPADSKVIAALESYAYFLAKGAPTGELVPGRGYPDVPKPALAMDFGRGSAVFAEKCAMCHGANGLGQKVDGQWSAPPLWGKESFNWGAGMASIKNAAGFIKANMPLGQGNSLSDQEAWDVATFIDSQERPQDPRFNGNVAGTRGLFHNTAMSMYGKTVNGVMLGQASPPSGRQNVAAPSEEKPAATR